MTALAEMIASQADAVEAMAALDLSDAARRLDGAERILLVGTGTSQHAAELGALAFESAGRNAYWLPSSTAARWAATPRPGDAVIVVTHTAETSYARAAREAALAAGVPVVSVVGRDRPVEWPEAVRTVPPERSETYTVSYLASVVVLARLAGAPDGDARRLAASVRAVLDAPGVDDIPLPARSMALIGAGPWGVAAREGALKIREGARVLAQGFDAERFLHGEAVPYSSADSLVLVAPEADPDGMVDALAGAARAAGMAVSSVAGEPSLGPVLGQLPATVRLQLLADRFAAVRGQDPDRAIVGPWAEPSLWRIGAPGAGR